jgi:hypothetical protein
MKSYFLRAEMSEIRERTNKGPQALEPSEMSTLWDIPCSETGSNSRRSLALTALEAPELVVGFCDGILFVGADNTTKHLCLHSNF